MWPFVLFGSGIVGLAALFLFRHQRKWEVLRQQERGAPHEWDFARRQYRRRMQTSILLGIIGGGLTIGGHAKEELPWLFYWAGLLVLIGWVILLATLDALSSWAYLRKARHRQLAEQALIQKDLLDELQRRRQAKRDEKDGESDDHVT